MNTFVFVPPGYKLLSDVRRATDANALRGQLAIGESTAFKIRDGELDEIHRSEWVAESGEAMLGCGYWVAGGFHHYSNGWSPRNPIATKYPIVVAIVEKRVEVDPAPRRPKGTGRQRTDAKLVKRMHELIAGGSVNSRTEAARAILKQDGALYGQSEAATIKRLVSRYKENYGE